MTIFRHSCGFLLLAMLSYAPGAWAASAGQSCANLGETRMAADTKSILACLRTDSAMLSDACAKVDGTPSGKCLYKSSQVSYGTGAWAGVCMQGWGGVDQIGTALAPATYDATVMISGDANERTLAASRGWTTRKGCTCPSGWARIGVSVCSIGYCKDPAKGGSVTGEIYTYACMKM